MAPLSCRVFHSKPPLNRKNSFHLSSVGHLLLQISLINLSAFVEHLSGCCFTITGWMVVV